MALKDTIKHLKDLLLSIAHDLDKADGGNKAASQRVRTGTVKLEKVAKLYRKESIKTEKQTKGPKKAGGKKVIAKKTTTKVKVKARPKAKAQFARPRAMSFRRPSAKLPVRA